MKKRIVLPPILFILVGVSILQSCGFVQKRSYNSGFNIQWPTFSSGKHKERQAKDFEVEKEEIASTDGVLKEESSAGQSELPKKLNSDFKLEIYSSFKEFINQEKMELSHYVKFEPSIKLKKFVLSDSMPKKRSVFAVKITDEPNGNLAFWIFLGSIALSFLMELIVVISSSIASSSIVFSIIYI